MTNEIEQLARRAVACPGWRWAPRMLANAGGLLAQVIDPPLVTFGRSGVVKGVDLGEYLPDFADRATLGCLEGLVCDAWAAEVMVLKEVIRSGPHAGKVSHRVAIFQPERSVDWGWTERYLFETAPDRAFRPVSRAEALVAALEAAPVRNTQAREEKSCPA